MCCCASRTSVGLNCLWQRADIKLSTKTDEDELLLNRKSLGAKLVNDEHRVQLNQVELKLGDSSLEAVGKMNCKIVTDNVEKKDTLAEPSYRLGLHDYARLTVGASDSFTRGETIQGLRVDLLLSHDVGYPQRRPHGTEWSARIK